MDEINNKFKFKVIKNFLTKEELSLLLDFTRIRHRINFESFDLQQSNNYDTKFYGDPITDSLLLQKKDLIQKEIGKALLPTYSFWRMYTHNAILKKHSDRESCEFSATVMLGSCGTKWPIFIDGVSVQLEPGEAVIYKGREFDHWREPFEGDWHSQCFLHYVDKEGPYKEFFRDKRMFWGGNI